MYQYTDDPVADFEAWDGEQERKLEQLPICEYCNERILGDYLYEIEGCLVCEECLDRYFRKNVEDFME
jgi:formylmethanofuran dehydrogenase subunit E